MKKNEFKGKFSLEKLKFNKFLSIYDSIDEIYDELIHEFSKNNPELIENENNIIINIPIGLSKFKEIVLILNEQSKTDKELCRDLYDIVCDLKKKIDEIEIDKNEKNEKINLLNKETEELKKLINNYSIQINNCNQKIENLSNDNKILKEKMNSLENELNHFKNENIKLNDKFQSSQKNIDILNEKMDILKLNFINVDNPWTDEKDKESKNFNYILKDGNYYAKRNNDTYIYSIKSKHKFEKNKVYQLIYNISYIEGNFRVGFGDFGFNINRLKEKGSIGFTNEGLYIDGVKINDIKIEKKNKTL
jgi:low affinity Fe/Cu permease